MVAAYQNALMWACIVALAAIGAFLFVKACLSSAWKALRRFASLGAIECVLCAALVVVMVLYGGSKGVSVNYDGGIRAGTTANNITNNTVAIYWQRNTSGGTYVPESAAVYIDYRLATDTNGVWTLLAETTVGAWGWSGTVQDATNYNYNVWAYYIPPEPVHTNGVWTYKTLRDRRGANIVPLRARIEVNGKAIATPKEVRRDEEQND